MPQKNVLDYLKKFNYEDCLDSNGHIDFPKAQAKLRADKDFNDLLNLANIPLTHLFDGVYCRDDGSIERDWTNIIRVVAENMRHHDKMRLLLVYC